QLAFQLLDLGAAHFGGLGVIAHALVEGFPVDLPVLHGLLGLGQRLGGAALGLLGLVEGGLEAGDLGAEGLHLLFVAGDVPIQLVPLGLGLFQFGLLALAQLARMLQGLLGARDGGAHFVEAALHLVEGIAGLVVTD